jgi:hypothetical protein
MMGLTTHIFTKIYNNNINAKNSKTDRHIQDIAKYQQNILSVLQHWFFQEKKFTDGIIEGN